MLTLAEINERIAKCEQDGFRWHRVSTEEYLWLLELARWADALDWSPNQESPSMYDKPEVRKHIKKLLRLGDEL